MALMHLGRFSTDSVSATHSCMYSVSANADENNTTLSILRPKRYRLEKSIAVHDQSSVAGIRVRVLRSLPEATEET